MKKVRFNIIYDRKHKATLQRPGTVEIRFTYGSLQKYISTGIKLYSDQWDGEFQEVIKREDADFLNAQIDAYRDRARSVVVEMTREGCGSLDEIPRRMEGQKIATIDFPSYCEMRSEKRNVSKSTKARYAVFCRFLRTWGRIQSFSDIEPSVIRDLDEYLHKMGKKDSTVCSYHKCLKLFINDAIIDGYVSENPYGKLNFKISRGESRYVRCLLPEQFSKLKNLDISNIKLRKAWHLFLFQCYTGMAYVDMMAFDFKRCTENTNGTLMYEANRVKTSTHFTFQILKPALKILETYGNKLPHISLQIYNERLKIVGKMIGVQGLRSHMGRATAATMFLSNGMPINVVAAVLGHNTLRQTQRYARTLEEDVMLNFDKMDGKI